MAGPRAIANAIRFAADPPPRQRETRGIERHQRRMIETIRAVYERYGFDPVETPAGGFTSGRL